MFQEAQPRLGTSGGFLEERTSKLRHEGEEAVPR
jgi:hypothetical protein